MRGAGIAKFFSRVDLLGRKIGPVLFQLPPNWALNLGGLEEFLEALPLHHRYSFEFRDPSWHNEEVYRLLKHHRTAFCAFHLAGFTSPRPVTADFAYVRLHGPGGKYQGSYDHAALRKWSALMHSWSVSSVYVYFDNDDRGFAAQNALELRSLME